VHLASMGHPCLGDRLYGRGTDSVTPRFGRQALHALALSIAHPRSGERLDFVAPLPEDFRQFLSARGIPATSEMLREWIDSQ
jgi:23S rRNA pseudouridine1911/1915/1917 synthase